MPKLLPRDSRRDKSVGGESCEISPDHSPLLRLGQGEVREIPLDTGNEIYINEQSPIIQQDISQDDRSPQETTLTRVSLFEKEKMGKEPKSTTAAVRRTGSGPVNAWEEFLIKEGTPQKSNQNSA